MDRRRFIKAAGAVAVTSAIPLHDLPDSRTLTFDIAPPVSYTYEIAWEGGIGGAREAITIRKIYDELGQLVWSDEENHEQTYRSRS